MAVSYMDYTSPSVTFTYDLSNNLFFKKDANNYINALSINQLNTLGNVSLLDIFLSTGNIVEPHLHQNASELVYCITGAAVVSLINPFTKELLNFPIQPGQVANVPQGWWHYEVASVDNTHLLAIFDAPIPEFIGGSDLLRLTPANIWARAYCLDEAKVKDTLAPITQTVFIGPPKDCNKYEVQGTSQKAAKPNASKPVYPNQANPNQAFPNQPNSSMPQYQQRYDFPQQQPYIGNGWGYNYNNNI
ncbi:cupin domain-containing protein [Paenibacillus sp. RC67]|uniref:cupin domain-containing protein n=1 Tax=Paenibacillus sp. RC67 TaxID=3039392 RepID=UPI0024AE1F76|nr:cupin domain-containing protein [Paenibacillus sp. RC67]